MAHERVRRAQMSQTDGVSNWGVIYARQTGEPARLRCLSNRDDDVVSTIWCKYSAADSGDVWRKYSAV